MYQAPFRAVGDHSHYRASLARCRCLGCLDCKRGCLPRNILERIPDGFCHNLCGQGEHSSQHSHNQSVRMHARASSPIGVRMHAYVQGRPTRVHADTIGYHARVRLHTCTAVNDCVAHLRDCLRQCGGDGRLRRGKTFSNIARFFFAALQITA